MKFCIHCGAPLKEGSKFCTSCGSAAGPQQATQLAPETPKEPTPVQQPAPKTPKATKTPGKLVTSIKKHPARSAICIALVAGLLVAAYLFYPRFPALKYDGATLRYGQVVSVDYLCDLFDEEPEDYISHVYNDYIYVSCQYNFDYESCTITSFSIGTQNDDASIGGIHVGDSVEKVMRKYWNAVRVTTESRTDAIRILLDRNGCPVIYSEELWVTSVTHYRIAFYLDEDDCVSDIYFG